MPLTGIAAKAGIPLLSARRGYCGQRHGTPAFAGMTKLEAVAGEFARPPAPAKVFSSRLLNICSRACKPQRSARTRTALTSG